MLHPIRTSMQMPGFYYVAATDVPRAMPARGIRTIQHVLPQPGDVMLRDALRKAQLLCYMQRDANLQKMDCNTITIARLKAQEQYSSSAIARWQCNPGHIDRCQHMNGLPHHTSSTDKFGSGEMTVRPEKSTRFPDRLPRKRPCLPFSRCTNPLQPH